MALGDPIPKRQSNLAKNLPRFQPATHRCFLFFIKLFHSFQRDIRHICQRIQFKICSLIRNCFIGSVPQYLKAEGLGKCTSIASIRSRSTLQSSARGHLVVPRTRTSMTQSRSFAIVGPLNWNKLPQSLRDLFPISSDQFRKHLEISIFVSDDTDPVGSASDLSGPI